MSKLMLYTIAQGLSGAIIALVLQNFIWRIKMDIYMIKCIKNKELQFPQPDENPYMGRGQWELLNKYNLTIGKYYENKNPLP